MFEPLLPHLRPKLESNYYLQGVNILAPKSLCIISKFSFIPQFKEILRQLYRIHISKSHIPIERYICNFTDEILIPIKGKNAIQYDIGSSSVIFSRPLNQIPPYADVLLLYYLFRKKTMNIYLEL